MNDHLAGLTEADIRARGTEASFERGQRYYAGGAIKRRIRHEVGLEAHVEGRETYRVQVWAGPAGITAHCTCPYDWGGDCKHIVATLLAWLAEPESFQPPVDLKAVLGRRTKPELVRLLLDILSVYPHLVDDFEISNGPDDRDLVEKVAQIFGNLQPWGHLTSDQAEARMQIIARRADRLAEQGQTDYARKIYYALVSHCVDLGKSYGDYDSFSADIPYQFAVAYETLALEGLEEHAETIKAELREIFSGSYNPEILWDTDEALSNVAYELGMFEDD
jgi:uncharacterized Zn finger protein